MFSFKGYAKQATAFKKKKHGEKSVKLREIKCFLPISDAMTVMLCQAASSLSSTCLVVISPVWASMLKLASE